MFDVGLPEFLVLLVLLLVVVGVVAFVMRRGSSKS